MCNGRKDDTGLCEWTKARRNARNLDSALSAPQGARDEYVCVCVSGRGSTSLIAPTRRETSVLSSRPQMGQWSIVFNNARWSEMPNARWKIGRVDSIFTHRQQVRHTAVTGPRNAMEPYPRVVVRVW